jgi:Zinc finger protein
MSRIYEEVQIEETDSAKDVLRKVLDPRFKLSPATLAECSGAPAPSTSNGMRTIGYGGCGIIFEQAGRSDVIKKALKTVDDDLYNDYLSHMIIEKSFDDLAETFLALPCLPRPHHFVSARDSTWWDTNIHRFPRKNATHDNLLFAERIPPVPAIVRNGLIDEYCLNEPLKEQAKADPANHDCLIRVYLGRKRETRTSGAPRQSWFALRNFKMDLLRLQDLGIDPTSFALSVAAALAGMHWHSNINARDVEFVLGGCPLETHHLKPKVADLEIKEPASTIKPDGETGKAVRLWLLDFNQCRKISMDQDGVDEAVDAFYVNDPYYPRPNIDKGLWDVFREEYLTSSSRIVGGTEYQALPALFIAGVLKRLNRGA